MNSEQLNSKIKIINFEKFWIIDKERRMLVEKIEKHWKTCKRNKIRINKIKLRKTRSFKKYNKLILRMEILRQHFNEFHK